MVYKILSKQASSNHCFICGKQNESGLQADFYELENKKVACVFTAKSIHEGHPNMLHGGVICSILDETAGRAMSVIDENMGADTMELNTKYLIPVPSNTELTAVGQVDEIKEKVYIASAMIFLPDGKIAAKAKGVYYKIKNIQTIKGAYHKVFPAEMDRYELELPDLEKSFDYNE